MPRWSCVREFLSDAEEREVIRRLKDQLLRQKRVTTDDIRLEARAVASKGGSINIPTDFPPLHWVLEFKRNHGFVQFDSFTFGADMMSGKATSILPAVQPFAEVRATLSRQKPWTSSTGTADEERGDPSENTYNCLEEMAHVASRAPYTNVPTQTHSQWQHDQRICRFQQHQQQERMVIVDDRRAAWKPVESDRKDPTSNDNLDCESRKTSATSADSSAGSRTPSEDETLTNSSPFTKRGYRLSHTVPAETWEKAIAAVEYQGMSLRAAAKTYGVHFAALHRRVKKRARSKAKGSNAYFSPSDEAGIMRVVVARAELGVLMTFEELMRLVETAALRKLPDISVGSAHKPLARFQSRNEQSIRHIIADWPPQPLVQRTTFPPVPATMRPRFYDEYSHYEFPLRRSAPPGSTLGHAPRIINGKDPVAMVGADNGLAFNANTFFRSPSQRVLVRGPGGFQEEIDPVLVV